MSAMQISHAVWIDGTPQRVPNVILIGVTDGGRSVSVEVSGDEIRPYLYVVFPDGIERRQRDVGQVVRDLVEFLNHVLRASLRSKNFPSKETIVNGTYERRTPADHYRSDKSHVAKLTFFNQSVLDAARRILEKPFGGRGDAIPAELLGILLHREGAAKAIESQNPSGWSIPTAEAVVDPASRFMVDRGLNPEDWIALPAGVRSKQRLTTCQDQWEAVYRQIRKSDRVGDSPKVVFVKASKTMKMQSPMYLISAPMPLCDR